MKIRACLLVVIHGLIHPLAATPDHSVSVTERVLGSNSTGFAVLRTEHDNMCSYYSSRVTTWLDEIPKTPNGREQMKSTLLLDVTRSRDSNHSDPNTPAPVTETINSQNATLSLASVLQRYPGQLQQAWTPEQIAKLEIDPNAGISYNGKLVFIHGSAIGEKIFGGRHGGEPWALDEVAEDADSIYLRLSVGQDEGPESRIVCVPPAITKRQRDQADAQPVYLTTGKFDTRDEAIQAARTLVEKAREKKFSDFFPEIWSLMDGDSTSKYVVAERFSTQMIKNGRLSEIESTLEIRLTPMSSDRFIERTKVVH